jgi:hypothetical protein
MALRLQVERMWDAERVLCGWLEWERGIGSSGASDSFELVVVRLFLAALPGAGVRPRRFVDIVEVREWAGVIFCFEVDAFTVERVGERDRGRVVLPKRC